MAGERVEDDLVERFAGVWRAIETAFDRVFQFAHIAGPGMLQEPRHRRAAKAGEGVAPQGPRHRARKMVGQERDVVGARAQRWQRHDVERQAVKQIATEPSGFGQRR